MVDTLRWWGVRLGRLTCRSRARSSFPVICSTVSGTHYSLKSMWQSLSLHALSNITEFVVSALVTLIHGCAQSSWATCECRIAQSRLWSASAPCQVRHVVATPAASIAPGEKFFVSDKATTRHRHPRAFFRSCSILIHTPTKATKLRGVCG